MPHVEHPKPVTDAFYQTVLDSLCDAVYCVDIGGQITYWNAACERLTGFSAREMVGQPYAQSPIAYAGPMTAGATHQRPGILRVLQTNVPGTWKGAVCSKNGQQLAIESHISPIRD